MIAGLSALDPLGRGASTTITSGSAPATTAGASGGASFAELLDRAADSLVGTLRGAESSAVDALQGKGDMRGVVDAVMTAEQSLQAAVAIRDKIVSAYLEVSRMAI